MGNLETKYSDLLKLELELSNSPDKEIVTNCESIGQIFRIFTKSHEILVKHFGTHDQLKINQAFMTRDAVHKYELDFYLNDLIYYLYTFLSSCKSLVDQTRIHCQKHHKSNELFTEYNIKVKETFAEDPLTKFIEGLRNFIVHYNILTVVSCRIFDDIAKELSVILHFDKDALLKSGYDWNSKGREY